MARNNEQTIRVDKIAGEKIHEKRLAMGLSRQQLAMLIDVTHQQLQKYEKGTNRISLGRMVVIAKALHEPINYFVSDYSTSNKLADKKQRMQIEVSRNFSRIENPEHQTAVNNLILTLAKK